MSTAIRPPSSPFKTFAVSYPGWLSSFVPDTTPRSVASAWIDRVSERGRVCMCGVRNNSYS